MDFIDWRKSAQQFHTESEKLKQTESKQRMQRRSSYVEETIRAAQERGEFSDLPGKGKPLQYLDDHFAAKENSMAYGLLKSNGYVPLELDLSRAITQQKERADAKLARLIHQGKSMRTRRFPPSEREKRAFNKAVKRAAEEYDETLRKINSKILTLNISGPDFLHRPLFKVEVLVGEFLAACVLFDVDETR